MARDKQVSVRIVAQGGEQLRAEFASIGREGTQAFQRIDEASGQMRGNVQNAAFQVQDFFVQVAAGTDPTRALAQQLPQLLGSMGLIGILAGTAAAAIIPLGAAFLGAKSDAEALKQTLEALDAAVKNLESANRSAGQSLTDLRATYGANAGAAREVLEIQREIAALTAGRAFASAARSVADNVGGPLADFSVDDLQGNAESLRAAKAEAEALEAAYQNLAAGVITLSEAEQEALSRRSIGNDLAFRNLVSYRELLRDVAGTFQISEEAAADLAVQIAQINEADTSAERLAAAQGLATAIFEQTDGLRTASEEGMALYDSLLQAVTAGLDLEALDIAGTIGAGADEAARLVATLDAAVTRAEQAAAANRALEERSIDQRPENRANAAFASRGTQSNRPIEDGAGNVIRPPVAEDTVTRGRGGGGGRGRGGGGGGGGITDAERARTEAMREAERVFRSTRTEAERYAEQQARLNELLAGGFIDADTYSRAMDDLGERLGDIGSSARALRGDFQQTFTAIVTGAQSARDAVSQLLSSLAARLADGAFDRLFGSLFGGGGGRGFGGGGGVAVPFFGGGRAGGGPVRSDAVYMVGEAGPELFMPSSAGRILPNAVMAAPSANVSVHFDLRGAERGVSDELVARLPVIERQMEKSIVQAVAGRMQRRGGRPG